MPSYIFQLTWLYSTWPHLLMALLIAFILAKVSKHFFKAQFANEYAFAYFAFALVGGVTGHLTGLSREPAVGAVLPAVLSLIGGFSIYIATTKEQSRALLIPSVIALSLCVLTGAFWGANERITWQNSVDQAVLQNRLETLKRQARDEWVIKDYRRQLGLKD